MPAASPFDPDLAQAISDLRITAARLRAAEAALAVLPPSATLKQTAAARQAVDDPRSLIRLRADRLQLDPAALLLILDEVNALRDRRRKLGTEELRQAVERIAIEAKAVELRAHQRAARMTTEAAAATKARLAADNAVLALIGSPEPAAAHG